MNPEARPRVEGNPQLVVRGGALLEVPMRAPEVDMGARQRAEARTKMRYKRQNKLRKTSLERTLMKTAIRDILLKSCVGIVN